MIDNQDKQTKPLDLGPAPKRRGRPAKENALSNAERQRQWRERMKSKSTGEGLVDEKRLEAAQKEIEAYKAAVTELCDRIERQWAEIKDLKEQLEQRNEKPSRLNEGMRKIIQDVHEIADATQGSTWRIQRKARVNGNWVTLKGSYWNEAKAEDALAALPNKKGGWWRIIEVKSEVED